MNSALKVWIFATTKHCIYGVIDLLYHAIREVQSPYIEFDAANDVAIISRNSSRLYRRSRPSDLVCIVSGG